MALELSIVNPFPLLTWKDFLFSNIRQTDSSFTLVRITLESSFHLLLADSPYLGSMCPYINSLKYCYTVTRFAWMKALVIVSPVVCKLNSIIPTPSLKVIHLRG